MTINKNTITNFTIFGERNSGTKYLEKTLRKMLKIKYTKEYGFKHWYIKGIYPRGVNNTTTDNECIKDINDSDNTLFILIVRNVYDWVNSMYKKPHHMKNIDKSSMYNFISKKYMCYEDEREKNTLWIKNKQHRYPYFIEESKNLIKLRNLKNTHFLNLRNRVKYFYIIRQEHLLNDIKRMIKQYGLKYNFLHLPNYKKPKTYSLDKKTVSYINKNLKNEIDSKFYRVKYSFGHLNKRRQHIHQEHIRKQQILKKQQNIQQRRIMIKRQQIRQQQIRQQRMIIRKRQ